MLYPPGTILEYIETGDRFTAITWDDWLRWVHENIRHPERYIRDRQHRVYQEDSQPMIEVGGSRPTYDNPDMYIVVVPTQEEEEEDQHDELQYYGQRE